MGASRFTDSRTVTGVIGSFPIRLIPTSIWRTGTFSTIERRFSSARRACQVFGRSAGESWTAVPGTVATSGWPPPSKISPRCASIRTERIWLSWAAFRYRGPERTCSAQSRKKRIPNTTSATAARIPIRSASCGVKR